MGVNGALLVFFGTLVLLVVWGLSVWLRFEKRDEQAKQEHLARADAVISGLFDGSPAVTYVPVDTSGGLPTETLVHAANVHRYRLISETGTGRSRRVVFEKVSGA